MISTTKLTSLLAECFKLRLGQDVTHRGALTELCAIPSWDSSALLDSAKAVTGDSKGTSSCRSGRWDASNRLESRSVLSGLALAGAGTSMSGAVGSAGKSMPGSQHA